MSILEQIRLLSIGWRDVLEIAIVGYAIYRVLLLLHRSRAVPVLIGIVVLLLTYAVAAVLKLTMITYLLTLVYTYGAIALLIIFAPELRIALSVIGHSPMLRFFRHMGETDVADETANAVERLSRSGIGAIVAIEREVPLDEYVRSGSEMQAKVSADLLTTIFTPYSPLHDGAVSFDPESIPKFDLDFNLEEASRPGPTMPSMPPIPPMPKPSAPKEFAEPALAAMSAPAPQLARPAAAIECGTA